MNIESLRRFSSLYHYLTNIALKGFFSPASLILNLRDSTGHALEYRRLAILTEALDLFCQKYLSDETKDFQNMAKSYLSAYLDLGSRVAFVVMVEYRILNMKGIEHELYLKGNLANHIIIDFFRLSQLVIKQTMSFNSYLLRISSVLYLVSKILLSKGLRPDDKDVRDSVWIEYPPSHGVWENFRKHVSRVVGKKYRITYYFDRGDTPFHREVREVLRKQGFFLLI